MESKKGAKDLGMGTPKVVSAKPRQKKKKVYYRVRDP